MRHRVVKVNQQLAQQVNMPVNNRQRGAQIVRNHMDKSFHLLLQLVLYSNVVERGNDPELLTRPACKSAPR